MALYKWVTGAITNLLNGGVTFVLGFWAHLVGEKSGTKQAVNSHLDNIQFLCAKNVI